MKTSFVILSQSRTGSTLLKQLINCHPKIICEDELFNLDEGYIKNEIFLNTWKKVPYPFIYYRRLRKSSTLYGFKLFTYHLERTGRAIHILYKLGWKIIYLKRADTVKQVLSAMVARKTDRWHRFEGEDVSIEKHTLPVSNFIERIEARIMWNNVEENILRTIPHLKLNYEENLQNESDWQHSLNEVFDYLGVDRFTVHSESKKMYKSSYSELIENYDELVKALKAHQLDYNLFT